MIYTVTSGPSSEPLTTSEVKTWLRVTSSTDDTLIASLIKAARVYAENFTGRALFTQTIKEYFDGWPYGGCIELGFGPVQSITSVKYYDTDGTLQTVSSSNYITDLISMPGRIVNHPDYTWPALQTRTNPVEIIYVAGYTATASIPDGIKAAMYLLIGFWYENREDIPVNKANPSVRSADILLHQYKIHL